MRRGKEWGQKKGGNGMLHVMRVKAKPKKVEFEALSTVDYVLPSLIDQLVDLTTVFTYSETHHHGHP